MVEKRAFQIVLAASGHGIDGEVTNKADKEITYNGKEIKVGLHLL
jgi:hypothetical protein